jgi:hypothetical protein
MSRAKVSAEIAEGCLGHVMTVVRGTYDAMTTSWRRRKEKLSNAVESIVGPTSKDKVGTHAERLVQPEGAVLLR